MAHLGMNDLAGVIALAAILTAGLAHGESPYGSSRTYRSDDGPTDYHYRYDDRHHHDHHHSYDHHRDERHERRPDHPSDGRAPRVTPHSTVISPQKENVTPF